MNLKIEIFETIDITQTSRQIQIKLREKSKSLESKCSFFLKPSWRTVLLKNGESDLSGRRGNVLHPRLQQYQHAEGGRSGGDVAGRQPHHLHLLPKQPPEPDCNLYRQRGFTKTLID